MNEGLYSRETVVVTAKIFKADVSCVSPSSRNTACKKCVTSSRRLRVNKSCIEIPEITVKASVSCVVLLKRSYVYIYAFLHVKFSPLSLCYTFTILLPQREDICRVGK